MKEKIVTRLQSLSQMIGDTMMRWLFFFFFCAALLNGEEALEVRLATENALYPLYLGSFENEGSDLPAATIKQLEGILRFDLSQNGSTTVIPSTPEREKLAKSLLKGTGTGWEKQRVSYVVKGSIKNHVLALRALNVQTGAIQSIDGIRLTGNLNEDRKAIHQAADALHEALFGVKGVASTRLLYTLKKGKTAEVWVSDYDGGNARQVTNENHLCVSPVFIPSKEGKISQNFLYVCYREGAPKIHLATLQGGNGKRLLQLRGNQLMPAVSRQRNQLALISDASGNPDVFLVDLDLEGGKTGKARQVYAVPYATQGSPVFNPEGTKLAFVSNKDGKARIYIMDIPAPGTTIKNIRPQLLVNRSRETTAPAWSPDGDKIAYTSNTEGTRQIFVYDLRKREELQITTGPGHKENPTWAPNSLHLAYNGATPKGSDIYIINLQELKPIAITHVQGEARFPSWELR